MKKVFIVLCAFFASQFVNGQSKGIIDNSASPHVKFKSINIGDCKWTSGFWADKFKVLETSMLPYMGEVLCGDVGHGLNNFKIAAGLKKLMLDSDLKDGLVFNLPWQKTAIPEKLTINNL